MEVNGDYTFDVPQQLVWNAIQDPQVLGSIMPGGEEFKEVGENQYEGRLKIKIGPVQGVFSANLTLSDVVAPTSYSIEVDGKGAPGFVKANGSMKLEAHGENQTFMEYSGTANVGGRIASVGQRLIDSSARSIIRQSLEALNAYLQAQVAQQQVIESVPASVSNRDKSIASESTESDPTSEPTPLPVSDYKPPSQFQLAINVARDVFNDTVPQELRPVVMASVIGIIGLIIWLILR